ncbi:hypothetical protein TgHK011_004242 [Trichoderma gracile]|nr:hypothetical protein TgHK011_004242 [Trichoderma gracile]
MGVSMFFSSPLFTSLTNFHLQPNQKPGTDFGKRGDGDKVLRLKPSTSTSADDRHPQGISLSGAPAADWTAAHPHRELLKPLPFATPRRCARSSRWHQGQDKDKEPPTPLKASYGTLEYCQSPTNTAAAWCFEVPAAYLGTNDECIRMQVPSSHEVPCLPHHPMSGLHGSNRQSRTSSVINQSIPPQINASYDTGCRSRLRGSKEGKDIRNGYPWSADEQASDSRWLENVRLPQPRLPMIRPLRNVDRAPRVPGSVNDSERTRVQAGSRH